jgi:hypothetical protein
MIGVIGLQLVTFCPAATILVVQGDIENTGIDREVTLDFYTFEVVNSGVIRFETNLNPDFEHFLFGIVDGQVPFDPIGHPFILSDNCRDPFECTINESSVFFERVLPEGSYVVMTSDSTEGDWDWFDGFVAVSSDVGFLSAPQNSYEYSIVGDVRGIQQWDGQLDGTFRVSNIPEPSVFTLSVLFCLTLCNQRRRETN